LLLVVVQLLELFFVGFVVVVGVAVVVVFNQQMKGVNDVRLCL